ncbi:MAG: amidase [Mycobacteriaceae bacterium]
MTEVEDYRRFDATGLAALVAQRQVGAAELLEQALQHSERTEPVLNALTHRMTDWARRRAAGELTGPFAGVPFLLKDLGQDLAGHPTSDGCAALSARPALTTSAVVQRLLDAGLVPFAKTSTPELGAKAVTEPEAFGPTRNPWDTARTPGGSSGGSAAAVAAGVVPAASGSDGGGSLRIPAACCGLVGLKPGRGLVPSGPDRDEGVFGASTPGVLTRSVRDTAALLDVLIAPDRTARYRSRLPDRPLLNEVGVDPGRLRVGYTTSSGLVDAVHPEAVAAVTDAAALLADLGHHVEEARTTYDDRAVARDFLTVWFVNAGHQVNGIRAITGGEDVELDTRIMAAIGRATPAPELMAALEGWHTHAAALAEVHSRYDLLLTPTLAQPPLTIGALATPPAARRAARAILAARGGRLVRAMGQVQEMVLANLGWVPFTQLANITGRPAVSLPLHWTAEGLPLGVQLIGDLGAEPLLVRVASQLEQARPWFDRLPPL